MALALIGPCMVVAPLVAVALVLAIPLWPIVVVATGCCWLLAVMLETLCGAIGFDGVDGWGNAARRVFRTVLTPWTYFDRPDRKPPQDR